jgi:hypothetical protein
VLLSDDGVGERRLGGFAGVIIVTITGDYGHGWLGNARFIFSLRTRNHANELNSTGRERARRAELAGDKEVESG